MKRFGLVGASGYIAPRHLRAIRDTGNELVVAMDVNDSVGIMDSYFPEAEFFTKFEALDEFVQDEELSGRKLDFLIICSPNYLHVPHMKFALRNGIDVICEKPLVINSHDLDVLKTYETRYQAKVNSILQLRLHPAIRDLRKKVLSAPKDEIFDVELTYMTSRGKWYLRSWKGFDEKSGGIATNIGVHFYDMLYYIFGPVLKNEVHYRDKKTCAGFIKYERANVRWLLTIDSSYLPYNAVRDDKLTYRSITVGGENIEFSKGFTDLHTESYLHILSGNGFGIDENRSATETVESIRVNDVVSIPVNAHPILERIKS